VTTAGFVLTGTASALALAAGVRVLRLRPADFRETYNGGQLPALVRAQRCPTVLACLSASLGLLGTVLLAVGR
jgi:hypothetical protein